MASNGDVFANYCQVTSGKNPSANPLCDDFNGDVCFVCLVRVIVPLVVSGESVAALFVIAYSANVVPVSAWLDEPPPQTNSPGGSKSSTRQNDCGRWNGCGECMS